MLGLRLGLGLGLANPNPNLTLTLTLTASLPGELGYAAPRRRWADPHAPLTMAVLTHSTHLAVLTHSSHHGRTHPLRAFLAVPPLARWADEYAARVATLQRLAPPKR